MIYYVKMRNFPILSRIISEGSKDQSFHKGGCPYEKDSSLILGIDLHIGYGRMQQSKIHR